MIYFFHASAGPVVAEAMFVNREEIPVYPVYRDPVSCCPREFLTLDFNNLS